MTNSEKVAYLKGLFEGMGLSSEEGEGKIISGILDVLTDMVGDVADLEDNAVELGDELDSVSADVAALESVIYDEDDEDDEDEDDCCDDASCGCHHHHHHDEDEDDDEMYSVTCPVCNTEITVDEDTLLNGTFKCPSCGEDLEFEFDGECDCDEDEEEDGEDKN